MCTETCSWRGPYGPPVFGITASSQAITHEKQISSLGDPLGPFPHRCRLPMPLFVSPLEKYSWLEVPNNCVQICLGNVKTNHFHKCWFLLKQILLSELWRALLCSPAKACTARERGSVGATHQTEWLICIPVPPRQHSLPTPLQTELLVLKARERLQAHTECESVGPIPSPPSPLAKTLLSVTT